jgi:hypothetical protein
VGSYDEHRNKALECFAAAQAASDARERIVLLEIAQQWLRLAKYVVTRHPGDTTPDDDPPILS